MNTPLGDKTPYKDRFDIVTKTLRHEAYGYDYKVPLMVLNALQEHQDRYRYLDALHYAGWESKDDIKYLNIIYKYAGDDKTYVDHGNTTRRKQIYQENGDSPYGRQSVFEIITGTKKWKEGATESEKAIIEPALKQLNDSLKASKKSWNDPINQNPVLRSYFNHAIAVGLDNLKLGMDTAFKKDDWSVKEEFKDVKPDAKAMDAVIKEFKELDVFSDELVTKSARDVSNALKDHMIAITKKHGEKAAGSLGYEWDGQITGLHDFLQTKPSADQLKDFYIDAFKKAASNFAIREAIKADRAANPQKYVRQDKLNAAAEKIKAILLCLKADNNKKFYEAAKKGENTEKNYVNKVGFAYYYDFEKESQAEQKETLAIMDEIASLGIENLKDLKNPEILKNPFWDNYSRPITDEEIKKLQQKVLDLKAAGLDWDEYVKSGVYEKMLKQNNIDISGEFDPYEMALFSNGGPRVKSVRMLTPRQWEFLQRLNRISMPAKNRVRIFPRWIMQVILKPGLNATVSIC